MPKITNTSAGPVPAAAAAACDRGEVVALVLMLAPWDDR